MPIAISRKVYDRLKFYVEANKKLGTDTSIRYEAEKAISFWVEEMEKIVLLKLDEEK